MRPDILELEVEALSHLSPQLRGLATALMQPSVGDTSCDPMSATPTLLTARLISAETLPAVQTAVSDRFKSVADRVDRARAEFADADADRAALITGASGPPPPAEPSPVLV